MSRYFHSLYPWPAVMMACTLLFAFQVGGAGKAFHIDEVQVVTLKDELRLHAKIHYGLSAPVLEALENGIPMPFELEVRVKSIHRWARDRTVAGSRQVHLLSYHALSGQHLLEDLNASSMTAFPDLQSALMYQGRIVSMHIARTSSLDRDRAHVVQLRSRLLVGRLPLPLRMESFFSPSWRLESGWYEWPL